jgi:hypothetical protein
VLLIVILLANSCNQITSIYAGLKRCCPKIKLNSSRTLMRGRKTKQDSRAAEFPKSLIEWNQTPAAFRPSVRALARELCHFASIVESLPIRSGRVTAQRASEVRPLLYYAPGSGFATGPPQPLSVSSVLTFIMCTMFTATESQMGCTQHLR